MKTVFFCNLPYAFGILKPLSEEATKRGHQQLWYVPSAISAAFPFKTASATNSIQEIKQFAPDCIFVPGNDVPGYLRGLKVQVFHGLAGEKKGHFRIRDYFDLYLTSGPYFTSRFEQLAQKHKDFYVYETGWCKTDPLFTIKEAVLARRAELLQQTGTKKIILYAPTFSPSLTSAPQLTDTITKLAANPDLLVLIKFHDKTDPAIVERYNNISHNKLVILADKDITEALQICDLMISDTSSVVYEFILLDKPVITLNSASENITWEDSGTPDAVYTAVIRTLFDHDRFAAGRATTIAQYHPYNDGLSSVRVFDAVEQHIRQFGIPEKRKLSLWRKFRIFRSYR